MTAPASPSATRSSSLAPQTTNETSLQPRGLTLRVTLLSLALAFFSGYMIPVVDMKMRNTFLGATHLPPGAVAVLLLAINPLLSLIARDRGKTALAALVVLACAGCPAFSFCARA